MDKVSLYDIITVEESKEDIITVPLVNKDNTVVKALNAFREKTGITKKFCITVHKEIPFSAGLGGGSSDAAAVLKLLNSISGAGLSEEELMEISAGIGSDVPMFIKEGPCIVWGRGERVRDVKFEFSRWYVILKPPFGLSTRDVYEEFDRHPEGGYMNDLEKPAFRLNPSLERYKEVLLQEGNPVLCGLSGSGSALFSLFLDEASASSAMKALKKKRELKECKLYMVQGID